MKPIKAKVLLTKPTAVFRQSDAVSPAQGRVTGVIALALSMLCVLAVLAFHFPEYLTTPQLRKQIPST